MRSGAIAIAGLPAQRPSTFYDPAILELVSEIRRLPAPPDAEDRPIQLGHLEAMNSPSLAQDRWLRTRDVAARLSIHVNTMRKLIQAGEFGEVLILSSQDKRVRESALDAFIRRRLA